MFNSTLVPNVLRFPHKPNRKPSTPTAMSLYWSEPLKQMVLTVDRQNENFTSTHLTRKKLNSISLHAGNLIAQGWQCWPYYGAVGWLLVSPEKASQGVSDV